MWKAILVNIFAGINRCDWVAKGIVQALPDASMSKVPLVVRLAGTNVEEGRKILAESGLQLIIAPILWRTPRRRSSTPEARRNGTATAARTPGRKS